MYIAASTIATAPITAYIQPCWKTPARIGNSPANADEPGTASAITPIVISTVASAGRPRAIPPRRSKLPGRRPPLDDAREQEQHRRDQAVVDHLEHRAVDAEVVRREEAERDQPHLRERRVGDHAADVRRAEGQERPVDEPDRREHEDRRPEVVHAGAGNSEKQIRRKPYAAAFETTPESTADTSGGDSR